ncbi:phosphoribosyltransferase-like protein [Janthinobacterium agaricidamnosum]|uniref:phosphoribosyltransferase-like protein n=1 Tax=Janthinobacterium agaricidamnosum TaxID=55508 RepID=UPI00056F8153|nr:hypothetical protein [Janthinobacterium agaricidamnosum]
MNERDALLVSIASTIQTYREGEIASPNVAHVDRWARQFSSENQIIFLREFDVVLKRTFLTKAKVLDLLAKVSENAVIVGANPAEFWRKAKVLDIQLNGHSQKEMIALMVPLLKQKFQVDLNAGGTPDGKYVYLDDVTYTGSRIASDISSWLKFAPPKASVKVISLVSYTSTYYARNTRTPKVIAESGKDVSVAYGQQIQVENRVTNNHNSGVFWPIALSEEQAADDYVRAQTLQYAARKPGGKSQVFITEEGRQVLEHEFLEAGRKIRSQIKSPTNVLKPLGFGSFGVGFGSTICTYRNCPNTSPLALWWGEQEGRGALEWYPLFPRKTYE